METNNYIILWFRCEHKIHEVGIVDNDYRHNLI